MRSPQIDPTIERRVFEGFQFPLGVYPVQTMTPRPGYVVEFEPADGGEEDDTNADWEEWPDRFMFDVAISADRLPSLVRMILAMLPGRVYPILDVLGGDAFREIDPYIAYEPVGVERFHDAFRDFEGWLLEDGLVGFGAMAVDPFFYFFVDEHKIITVRTTLEFKETFVKLLAAFDLPEVDEICGPDAAEHEHRGVLAPPGARADRVQSSSQIVEFLKDAWLLQLNIDTLSNTDDEGRELGRTAWRCLVRTRVSADAPARYAEVWVVAEHLDAAEQLCFTAVTDDAAGGDAPAEAIEWHEVNPIFCDRLTEQTASRETALPVDLSGNKVLLLRWVDSGAAAEQAGG